MMRNKAIKGFTLLEILLVLAITGTITVLSIGIMQQKFDASRRAKVSLQVQQILNAGLAYYVGKGQWPANLAQLQGSYLPPAAVGLKNPWNKDFSISSASSASAFYVFTDVASTVNANIVAGMLPLAYTTTTSTGSPPAPATCAAGATSCFVVSQVNVPGQNLNNATAINFAGLYHSGGCVPVPSCPFDGSGDSMTPQIIVVPVQINGLASDPQTSCTADSRGVWSCSNAAASPIISFTATATGGPGTQQPVRCLTATPAACIQSSWAGGSAPSSPQPAGVDAGSITANPNGFWRVCISIATEGGGASSITPSNMAWGQAMGTVMAVTRCAVKDEELRSSDMNVWDN
jgi:prepilin-type N-terminal cleavage/methylation domain-containing protein